MPCSVSGEIPNKVDAGLSYLDILTCTGHAAGYNSNTCVEPVGKRGSYTETSG
jgi:hypothetical protein